MSKYTLRPETIRGLRWLAAGGAPAEPCCALCHNVTVTYDTEARDREYDQLRRIFRAMGLDSFCPSGFPWYAAYPWAGEAGIARRRLAADIIRFISAEEPTDDR